MTSERAEALEAVARIARTVLERVKADLGIAAFECGCDYCQLASALRRLNEVQK